MTKLGAKDLVQQFENPLRIGIADPVEYRLGFLARRDQLVFAEFRKVLRQCGLAQPDALRQIPRHAYGDFAAQAVAWAKRCYLVFVCLGALTAYLLVIPVLGFSIASLIFLFVLQVILMPRTPKSIALAAVVAVVFSFGLNWLFAEVFTVFLPRGVL